MKRFKIFNSLFAAALLVIATAVAAPAQVTTIEGKVTLKQADGTEVPVQGATVELHRTDISQKLGSVKTDKNGRYVRVGVPVTSTLTILVSAPGARPDFVAGAKPGAQPVYNFVLTPGDGRALTIDEVKKAAPGGAAPAAAPADSEEAKKKAAELAAERERIEKENAKAAELNTKLPEILKAGNDAFNAKNYDLAVAKYNEGIAADPTQIVFPRNKTLALRARAIDRFNAAVKAKDQAGKEAARNDLKEAVESAEKALANHRAGAANKGAGAPAAGGQQNEELGLLEIRAETYRLALQTSSPIDSNAAAKAIEEYLAVESDAAKKNKTEASLGDALFFSGQIDASIAKFREIIARNPANLDAIFGLGIALAAKSAEDPTMIAEAKKTLEQFVSKAPDGYPRKQDATEAVAYLTESMKAAEAAGKTQQQQRGNQRRRP